ncbi:hypothetical protein HOLleu_40960 [Holothuria leucospilota]|uniref:Uncharacterized protein n=1 Tax=Holothuria leucospilota TaxID=206669 RepID=A0A9Q1BDG3_HOLLE|nr:hypothetical protein HOLleu_40960 [Holothuria leucospilota]
MYPFIFQEGTGVEAAVRNKLEIYRQTYLLSLGPSKKPAQFFMVVDTIPISCGNSLLPAVDRLFKAHYVFNVRYSPALQHFWNWFAAFVYAVTPPTSVKPEVRALATTIRGTIIESNKYQWSSNYELLNTLFFVLV